VSGSAQTVANYAADVPSTVDEILALAEDRGGLVPTGDESFFEGLGLLATALDQPNVRRGGRSMIISEIANQLVNRLRVDAHHAAHPRLAAQPVDAPIVILGLPRSGTTALSYLLDRSPDVRSLLNWEAVMSVPPPTSATLRTDPRCIEMLEFQRAVFPAIDPPPPHWEWADGPTECTFVLAQDAKSVMWDARIPLAEHREWIESCDMAAAYRHHRRTLQILQSEAPGQWVLKMPAHAFFIDALLAEYPDARIIWTHRDPIRCVASFLDLAGFSQRLSLGEPDRDWIVETFPRRLADYIRRAERALAGRNVLHVNYDELVGDPIGTGTSALRWAGLDVSDQTVEAMQRWVDADPLRRPRTTPYSLADWGLEPTDLDPIFHDYACAHGLPT
jgi:hypothetical protein